MKAPDLIHLVLVALLLTGGTVAAVAQDLGETGAGGSPDTSVAAPDTSSNPAAAAASATPSIQSSLGKYGDPAGIRAFLDAKGIDYSFTYIGDLLGNVSGGVKRGATYEGQLNGQLDIDLEKLGGLKGAALHANFYQIHGRGLTGNNTMDPFTTSSIEAYPTTRLYEAWYEQKLDDGKIFVRIGQLAADTEFFISQTATLFVNSSFAFPAILANDLPDGGPAYPLATPGARIKVTPTDNLTLFAAVFNGDPAGPFIPGVNNPLAQIRDFSGTNFRVEDPPLLFTESQYVYDLGKDKKGLPGTVKIGYLHHFGQFAATGVSFTENLRGDDVVYAIIDQTIYREPGAAGQQGAAMFLRASGAPSDRNLIDLYIDGGITYQGLIAGRPDDTIGISGAYARISPAVAFQDRISGAAPLVRDYQGLIEATYQYVVRPGFSLQPDFQYIFHPGAHDVADPIDGLSIRDAAVFGLRATVHY